MSLFPNKESKNCNGCKRPKEEKDFLCKICKRQAIDYWEGEQEKINLNIK